MLSQVTIEELRKSMLSTKPPKVIDVREAEEFARGHVKGAELIPLSNLGKEMKRKYPNKSEPVVLYDDLGIRSHHGARLLRSMGYHNVKEILGGLFAFGKIRGLVG
ncbi:MAG TPA: rhodanese-like domain-containing protein [Candidatus Kapabacteria bacterium]|jgi:adenylyltransferase/sulfurtransferase|nr:rhodanese-like domain-containing protein [Candidatus Kapabacteria bacterium]